MRLIIDGCDKSGKTTLIEALKNEIPSLVGLKLLTKPKDGSQTSQKYIKAMYMHMAEMTRDQKAHYLFDRYYPSEMVYSFKRNYDAMKDPWFWAFEKELVKTPNLYILLHVDSEVIKGRFIKNNETFARADEIKRIQTRYLKHFKQSQLNKIIIDPTDDLEGAIKKIKASMDFILKPKAKDFTDGDFGLDEINIEEDNQ